MQQPSPDQSPQNPRDSAGADPTTAVPPETLLAAKRRADRERWDASSLRERWDDYWGLRERNRPLARLRCDLQGCAFAVEVSTELFPDFAEMHRLKQIAETIKATIYSVPFSETLMLADQAITLLDDDLIKRVLTTPLSEEMEDGEKRDFLEGLVRAVKELRRLLLEIQPQTF